MATESKTVHSPMVTYASMLTLLACCPPFVILLWYTMVHADGSVLKTWNYLSQHGLLGFLDIWPRPTAIACKIIACYAIFEAALQLLLPGKRVEGPISPNGNRPVYKANGLQAYAVTLVVYLSLWWFEIFNPKIVYDHLGEIFSTLIFGSLIFCVFLYIKGHIAPSSTDSGSSGNVIIDFYWGMELYPRIGKHFDIKVFTNCRFGMMSWAVLAVTYCIKQYEEYGKVADSMIVNTILMLVYVTKFFWWEAGYWNTMDIAHDRAGFYICWGCLVWVPSVYTSPGMYLVKNPVHLGLQLALYILLAGILCIYINYDCDKQRQEFRRTNGKCVVWGKAPSKILASYTTASGETKTSLLLTSGWWGLARHFHYVPEILAAFFWTVPALFNHVIFSSNKILNFYILSKCDLAINNTSFLHISNVCIPLKFNHFFQSPCSSFLISMFCFSPSCSLTVQKGTMIDANQSMASTGNCIAKRFHTGLFQEFTEKILLWSQEY